MTETIDEGVDEYTFGELTFDATLYAEAESVIDGKVRIVSANHFLGYIETHTFSDIHHANIWLGYIAEYGNPETKHYVVGADILEGM